MARKKEKTEELNFDFSTIETKEKSASTSNKKSVYEVLPKEYDKGVADFKKIKEVEAQLETIKASPEIQKLKNYVVNTWIGKAAVGAFKKSIDFISEAQGTIKLVSQDKFKKIDSTKLPDLEKLFGKENIDLMVKKEEVLTSKSSSREELLESFKNFVTQNKIDAETAKKFFAFLMTNFIVELNYTIDKEKVNLESIVKLGKGDLDCTKKIVSSIAYEPYLRD
jgi:hypothetical protein